VNEYKGSTTLPCRLVSSSDEACSQSGSDNDTAAEEQTEFERVQLLFILQGIRSRKMDEMIQLFQPIQNKNQPRSPGVRPRRATTAV
jgi:hypothetical protein